jgi:hypothetical protein
VKDSAVGLRPQLCPLDSFHGRRTGDVPPVNHRHVWRQSILHEQELPVGHDEKCFAQPLPSQHAPARSRRPEGRALHEEEYPFLAQQLVLYIALETEGQAPYHPLGPRVGFGVGGAVTRPFAGLRLPGGAMPRCSPTGAIGKQSLPSLPKQGERRVLFQPSYLSGRPPPQERDSRS